MAAGEEGDMKGERLDEGRWRRRKELGEEGTERNGGGLFVGFKRGEWKGWEQKHVL